MTTNFQHYVAEAIQTASSEFHDEKVPAYMLRAVVRGLMHDAEMLDRMKKSIFYGRDFGDGEEVTERHWDRHLHGSIGADFDAIADRDLFHGMIGILTEAGEIADIVDHMFDTTEDLEPNTTHMVEELGDIMWYVALCINALGVDPAAVLAGNLNKLRARYKGGTFTTSEANNRDTVVELDAVRKG